MTRGAHPVSCRILFDCCDGIPLDQFGRQFDFSEHFIFSFHDEVDGDPGHFVEGDRDGGERGALELGDSGVLGPEQRDVFRDAFSGQFLDEPVDFERPHVFSGDPDGGAAGVDELFDGEVKGFAAGEVDEVFGGIDAASRIFMATPSVRPQPV
jgi:hypothetical protein